MKNFSVICTILALFFASGCNYRVEKNKGDDGILGQDLGQIDYAFVLENIIKPRCFECHSVTREVRDGVALDTYAQLKALASDVRAAIVSGSMPKNRAPLNASEKQIILAWIDAGAPEKIQAGPKPEPTAPEAEPGNPTQPDPEAALDYATVHKIVIEPMCFQCHQAPNNRGNVNLESYEEVLKNIVKVKKTIEDGSMPRRRTMSPEQKSMSLNWIAGGAPKEVQVDSFEQAAEESLNGSLVNFLLQQDEEKQQHGE